MSNMSSICDKNHTWEIERLFGNPFKVKGSQIEDAYGEFAFRQCFLQIRANREEIP